MPKGFVFHFKAHQIFTHGNTDYAKLPRLIRDTWPHPHGTTAKDVQRDDIPEAIQEQLMFLFNLALKEVQQADKLGIVVFQFPETFVCSDANKSLIAKYRKWLDPAVKMGLELRSESWFFDANDFAEFKDGTRSVPVETTVPTARFRETLAWAESVGPLVTLIAIDEYAKRDAKPTPQMPNPRRVTPIVTQVLGDEWYIRVHRRVGEDRLLTDDELKEWARRIRELPVAPKRVWMMWNTNHETQAIDNGAKLEALLPAELVANWKEMYLEAQKANKGSIFAFFGNSQSPKSKGKEKEEEEKKKDSSEAKRVSPPASDASQPSPQKKSKPDAAGSISAFFKPGSK